MKGLRIIVALTTVLATHSIGAAEVMAQTVLETAREIPVAYDVDVVVVGGSSGAVAAAVAAAGHGAKVFLAAPRPYLGEDLCATWRIWLEPGEEPADPLAQQIFTKKSTPPTPMQVKRTLDEALLEASVPFLYGCYAVDVLRDRHGGLAGIVMANRAGRQAVRAKVIIDATPRAAVARLAGVSFSAFPAGPQTFTRVVIGGDVHESSGLRGHIIAGRVQAEPSKEKGPSQFDAVEYTLNIPVQDGSFASFARVEQQARDLSWDPNQVTASEVLFQVPPDPMHAAKPLSGPWPGAEHVDLDTFRPAKQRGLYILGGCADLSREAAATLLRPLNLMAMGRRIGEAASNEAKAHGSLKHVCVADASQSKIQNPKSKIPNVPDEIRETLTGLKASSSGLQTVHSDDRLLPVLGSYDVVVVGGGTGGAPAGIGAARQGAKTLVIEYLDGLGGVGTLGLIGKYYFGYRDGFTAELDKGVAAMGAGNVHTDGSWNVEWKMEWYRRELRKAGAEIWFGAMGCGAVCEGSRVTGVVVATPEGRGVVLAKVVIDATGNADVAAEAGAACVSVDAADIAIQGTGMPPREPGANYTNTDYTMTADADVVDVWRTFVAGRNKYRRAFDLVQIIDSRERRRIVGDYALSPLDIWNHRTFPDSVALSESNFDTHGYTIHPLFALAPPHKDRISTYTPYRCFLPKGLDGILVTGLGVSAHRDAVPILRMQSDIQNHGYAMGVAAAMASKINGATRNIDIKALQKHLVEKRNLPESVLSDTDSYPLSNERIAAAVASVVNNYDGVAVILAFPDAALPLLRDAYAAANAPEAKLIYAHVLGMLGDPSGAAALVQAVSDQAWDTGWSLTGMGQFGPSLSPLDSRIIALGNTRDPRAIEVILAKLAALDATSAFSHHRALALAFETLRDPKAAAPLAALLHKPGMTGFACEDIATAKRTAETADPNVDRDRSLRELILARALYRCGDHEGLGKRILEAYSRDLRAYFARHAYLVLHAK